MSRFVTIAIDAMGGDFGPAVILPGLDLSAERHPDLNFILHGDEAIIRPLLGQHPRLADRLQLFHTDVHVRMDDKPSQALRHGRWKSSMWRALEAVKQGQAEAAVSAGNTGALMAMSKFCLRTVHGLERPALAALWPTLVGDCIVLDVGASVGADKDTLVALAVLGAAMARALYDVDKPRVALLNIGVEEAKGLEPIREAHALLRQANLPNLHYAGFLEANDIGKGEVDVVVTEGFAGNIALKAAEGAVKLVTEYLRSALRRTLAAKCGAVLARGAFQALRDKLHPDSLNGAVLLGLSGIVIKSHGGASAEGFANAVDLGYDMVRARLIAKVDAGLASSPLMPSLRPPETALAPDGGAAP